MDFVLDIDGEHISISPSDLEIKDVATDAPRSAADIFYWGSVAAVLRQRAEAARSDYRSLKARASIEALRTDPKLPEWKCTMAFEASEAFRKAKALIEQWQRLSDQADAIYEACRTRSSTIQTIYNHEQPHKSYAGALGSEAPDRRNSEKVAALRRVLRKES
jgi:hypothetical protein